MLVDSALVAGGLTVLLLGAWQLVRSAVVIALSFGLSRVVVGATVVALGTSAPELVISVIAASGDAAGLAIGNVVGSNVANVALVLGSSALIVPLAIDARLVRWEIPVLIGATGMVLALGWDGVISRVEGALLVASLGGFVLASLVLIRTQGTEAETASREEMPESLWLSVLLLLVGLAALAIGAAVAVEGAKGIAVGLGMSEVAVGVSIVAVGTSLPEVATSLVAAWRREHAIAVANVVGSNIFNLLGVLGATALTAPLALDRSLYTLEIPFLAASSLVIVPLVAWWSRHLVDRREGALLVVLYLLFLLVAVAR